MWLFYRSPFRFRYTVVSKFIAHIRFHLFPFSGIRIGFISLLQVVYNEVVHWVLYSGVSKNKQYYQFYFKLILALKYLVEYESTFLSSFITDLLPRFWPNTRLEKHQHQYQRFFSRPFGSRRQRSMGKRQQRLGIGSSNGGNNWSFTQVKGFEKADFRSLYAFNAKAAVIANAGSPANILVTNDGGLHWQVVYTNTDLCCFF